MNKEDGYDQKCQCLRLLHRWYRKHCEDNEEWQPFSDCVDYDETTGTYVIIFKGTSKDNVDVVTFLNQRPWAES